MLLMVCKPEEFYNLVKGDVNTPAFERGYGQPKPTKVESDIQKAIADTGTPALYPQTATG
jgi:hypothetical protein